MQPSIPAPASKSPLSSIRIPSPHTHLPIDLRLVETNSPYAQGQGKQNRAPKIFDNWLCFFEPSRPAGHSDRHVA